jgi:hypothetical protein
VRREEEAGVQKNDRGEFTGVRTDTQVDRDRRFKDVAVQQIVDSGENWAIHSLAVMKRNALARVIYLNDLYQRILPVPGVICEFGVQWGATLATLSNLRALYEPYNASRTVFGFDTFAGFESTQAADGALVKTGDYASRPGYEATLEEILAYHESICPFPERRNFQLIKGDATVTIDGWLADNPSAVISLAIFDMDLYEPTKVVLEKIRDRLTRGSILVFDEFNCKYFPGETTAVIEALGLRNIRPVRHPLQSYCAIVEVDG